MQLRMLLHDDYIAVMFGCQFQLPSRTNEVITS